MLIPTWSKFDCRRSGAAFFTLAEIVKPKPEVRHLLFTSYDGYSTNVRLEDCMHADVLIATQFDGQPIPREHGGPARVIIPKLYAWKGAKFVRSIEFASEDRLGFWGLRGYSKYRRSLDRGPVFLGVAQASRWRAAAVPQGENGDERSALQFTSISKVP